MQGTLGELTLATSTINPMDSSVSKKPHLVLHAIRITEFSNDTTK